MLALSTIISYTINNLETLLKKGLIMNLYHLASQETLNELLEALLASYEQSHQPMEMYEVAGKVCELLFYMYIDNDAEVSPSLLSLREKLIQENQDDLNCYKKWGESCSDFENISFDYINNQRIIESIDEAVRISKARNKA